MCVVFFEDEADGMTHVWDSLNTEQYVNLTTFRKNGDGVPTPVWFVRDGDKLFIYTQANSGKVKRIRNNAQVTLAACNVRGEAHGELLNAHARILTADESTHIEALFDKKYGATKRFFAFLGFLNRLFRGAQAERIYLEVAA